MFLFKNKLTTIDIGCHSIKAASFISKKGEISILDTAYQTLPFETIKEGLIVDTSLVANKINELMDKLNARSGKIIITIPSENVIIRNLELPKMTEEELQEAIKWESEEYLPFPVDNAYLGYITLSTAEDKMEVLLVAAKSEVVENYLSPFEKNGLKPTVLNVQPMALLSLLKYQDELNEPSAIIDIGAANTNVIIGDQSNIYLSRSIDIAGEEFTRLLMEDRQIDYHEAEEYKQENGIEGNVEQINDDLDLILAEIAVTSEMGNGKFLSSLIRNLATEISRSLDFFAMKNRGKSISKTFITGGGSKLDGLSDLLGKELNREINRIDPFKGIKAPIKAVLADEFSVAIGLGISEVMKNEG